MIANIHYDLRYALRMLRKHPGFTLIALLTLALGIGANAAIFSLTDAVLLQNLPVRDPGQLTAISSYDPKSGSDLNNSFSYPMYQDFRDKSDVFSGVIARGGAQMNVSYDGRNDRIRGELVSGNYFEVLGVQPWAGRLFNQEDDRTPSAHPVAVLSYGFWERRFGKDAGVIGKTILVNEHPLTVIGITPPGFYGLDLSSNADVRVPLMMTPVFNPLPPTRLQSRNFQWLTLMARRRDGVTMDRAQASMKRFKLGAPDDDVPWITIVGVAGDVRQMGIDEPVKAEMYFPYQQSNDQQWFAPRDLAIRTSVDPLSLAAVVRNEIHQVDPDQPISDVRTMDEVLGEETTSRRLGMTLLTIFAALALLLATLGIYGVLAYFVVQHTQEIGVRMALGAQRSDILRLVVMKGMRLAVPGVVIGLVAAFAQTRLMSSLLYGVGTADPLTYATIALLLIGVALLACYLPARRATKVDPMVALIYE